ncbi:MAG: dihydrofolate reductase family protein [Actinobacteria bacterium]|nr:dihydrofolate reductase family protein [Actinomycetota bacterium]
MGRLVATEFLSLDGVSQAPGGPDEDRDGGFEHGVWHMAFMDEVAQKWVTDSISAADGFVLGRRAYQIFAAYWPTAPDEEHTIAEPLNSRPKYVVSSTLKPPLARQKSSAAST